jgi:hypothetical protein
METKPRKNYSAAIPDEPVKSKICNNHSHANFLRKYFLIFYNYKLNLWKVTNVVINYKEYEILD